MYTFPMKAPKSNSSRVGRPTSGLRPAMRSIQHNNKSERMRFIFSIGLFVFTITGLVVGSSSGVIQEVAAREDYGAGYSRNRPNDRPNQSIHRTTQQQNQQLRQTPSQQTPSQQNPGQNRTVPVTPERTAPSQPAPVAPTEAPATTPPPSQVQAATPTRSAPVRTAPVQSPVAPDPAKEAALVNTAPEIETMTAAKAVNPVDTITYTSNQISNETRNRLLALAVSATTSGVLIFAMSLFKSPSTVASVRYRIPVREVATH